MFDFEFGTKVQKFLQECSKNGVQILGIEKIGLDLTSEELTFVSKLIENLCDLKTQESVYLFWKSYGKEKDRSIVFSLEVLRLISVRFEDFVIFFKNFSSEELEQARVFVSKPVFAFIRLYLDNPAL